MHVCIASALITGDTLTVLRACPLKAEEFELFSSLLMTPSKKKRGWCVTSKGVDVQTLANAPEVPSVIAGDVLQIHRSTSQNVRDAVRVRTLGRQVVMVGLERIIPALGAVPKPSWKHEHSAGKNARRPAIKHRHCEGMTLLSLRLPLRTLSSTEWRPFVHQKRSQNETVRGAHAQL
jgi:hypothetical protein